MMTPMFYFLLALTAAVLAATANASSPILDSDGDIIVEGSYYVRPVYFYHVNGGGLNLNPRGGSRCPLFVGQEIPLLLKGLPIRFSNWSSRVGFVPESENLNIEMDIQATICGKSTYWKVASSDGDNTPQFIEAGTKPQPGEDSRSFFQIKKFGHTAGYNFAYCPEDTPKPL